MTLTDGPRRRYPAPRLAGLGVLVVVCLGAISVTRVAAAQEAEPDIAGAEQAYRAARATYQAALENWQVQERPYSEALDEFFAARAIGDSEQEEAALRRFYARSGELQRLDRRVSETQAVLDEARELLVAALDARLNVIQERLAEPISPAERQRLDAEALDLSFQYQELDDEGSNVLSTEAGVFYPTIDFDDKDGPTDWRIKAQLAERRAEQADTQLAEVDRNIRRVENLQRLQRNRQDARATRDRFGDAELPVSSAGPDRERGAEALADTTGVALEELPLDRRLEILREVRVQLALLVDQLKARAQAFRDRLARTVSRGGT